MLWLSSCARGQVVEPDPPTPITTFTPALWKRWAMDWISWSDATASVAWTLSSAVSDDGDVQLLEVRSARPSPRERQSLRRRRSPPSSP